MFSTDPISLGEAFLDYFKKRVEQSDLFGKSNPLSLVLFEFLYMHLFHYFHYNVVI